MVQTSTRSSITIPFCKVEVTVEALANLFWEAIGFCVEKRGPTAKPKAAYPIVLAASPQG
jgi:hypothetical protein